MFAAKVYETYERLRMQRIWDAIVPFFHNLPVQDEGAFCGHGWEVRLRRGDPSKWDWVVRGQEGPVDGENIPNDLVTGRVGAQHQGQPLHYYSEGGVLSAPAQ